MYLAIYDENKKHITNIDNATFDLTRRVYDADGFSAVGQSVENINDAKYLILCDKTGKYMYSCFVDNITPEDNTRTVKGLDFKTIFDTEILLDYTEPGAFDGKLSSIFRKVAELVLNDPDVMMQKIEVNLIIPNDATDTTETFDSRQDTYEIVNAYAFLKCYLKYYEYNVEAAFNPVTGKIDIAFVHNTTRQTLVLADFIYELQTTSQTTNKTVATISYDPKKTDDEGNEIIVPRPETIATKYYYLTKNNDIVEADATGNIDGRIYPVRAKMFEKEYLADAQFDAVYELANARYVDNVILDNNAIIDPIDLSVFPLYTKFDLYYDGKFYKTLPMSEKTTTADADGTNTKIKLGFKKVLLTEIIKA